MRTTVHDAWRMVGLTWSINPGLPVIRLITSVINGLLPLLQAYLAGRLIDALVGIVGGTTDIRQAYLFIVLSALAVLFDQLLSSFGNYYDQLTSAHFDRELECRLNAQILRLDQSYYEEGEFTALVVKVRENLYSLRNFVDRLSGLGQAIIGILGSAVILVSFSPILLLVVGAVVVPLTHVEFTANAARSKFWDRATERWQFLGFLRWRLFGNVGSLKELKLYQAESHFLRRFTETTKSLDDEQLAIGRRTELGRLGVRVIGIVVDAGIQLWLAARVLLSRGAFGVGDFQFYRGVIQTLGTGVSSVAFNMQQLQDSFLYIHDYFKLMDFEPRLVLPDPGVRLPAATIPRIEFQNVSFRYPSSRQTVLRDISFVLEPGERLAIVGVNGAGKTTLLKLLLRLYDPTRGTILVGDTPLPDLNLPSWYDQLGFLFQDFTQYGPLTVAENVALGRLERREDTRRLNRALKQADAATFVSDLPKGLDQVLEASYKEGTELSGGQWQRLALARSFFREPNVLVLDEPTSAIDAAAEHAIFNHLFKAHEGKSMIIVSHRFSTVRRAHRILVLEHGRMVEYGTHAELMRRRGKYRQLFELQAEGYRSGS